MGPPLKPLLYFILVIGFYFFLQNMAFAGPKLPGADASDELAAAGTLLRILDTALFVWGARIFAGIAILSCGWALKEQKFGIAIISIISAIIFGTANIWVKNIFSISGGGGLFN